MKSIEKLALTKLVKDEEAKQTREKVSPGEYDVDFLLHVHGTLKVGNDFEKAATVAIPLKETMALLLHRMGVTREKAKEILIDVLTDAITEKGKGEGSILSEYKEEIEAAEAHVKEIISTLPRIPCKGPVKANLLLEQVKVQAKAKKSA